MSSNTATMDMERKDTECDGQLSEYDDQPEVGNVEPNGDHEIKNSKDDSQSDMETLNMRYHFKTMSVAQSLIWGNAKRVMMNALEWAAAMDLWLWVVVGLFFLWW